MTQHKEQDVRQLIIDDTTEEDLCLSKMSDSKNNGLYFSTVDDLLIKDRVISQRDFKSLGREIQILQTALQTRTHS